MRCTLSENITVDKTRARCACWHCRAMRMQMPINTACSVRAPGAHTQIESKTEFSSRFSLSSRRAIVRRFFPFRICRRCCVCERESVVSVETLSDTLHIVFETWFGFKWARTSISWLQLGWVREQLICRAKFINYYVFVCAQYSQWPQHPSNAKNKLKSKEKKKSRRNEKSPRRKNEREEKLN